jgi:lipoprotein-anchoring transpeptidase ErfK/SrfK
MRRILASALLASAVCGPAWADPLAINPAGNAATAGFLVDQGGARPTSQVAANDQESIARDQRYAAQAAQAPVGPASTAPSAAASGNRGANMGGGFIQLLFGGTAREQAVPRPFQPPTPGYASNEPGYVPVGGTELSHPPVDAKFDRQDVDYTGSEKPGTIVIDTTQHFLFLVEDNGKAMRYGIGVGKPGFTWSGVKTITAKREWPDWVPPSEMIARRPDLPRYMAGGPENPLGARAMYLGSTLYRIHGSNEPWTIGGDVSSGCIRLRNADVIDLYSRVAVGAKVIVM